MDYADLLANRQATPKKPIPMPISRQEIFQLGKTLDEYDKSLLFFAYLAGPRASELVQVKTGDFEFIQMPDGQKQVKVRLNTRKKRRGIPFRELPLRSSSEIENEMLMTVLRHRATFARLGHPLLFPYCRTTIWKKFAKLTCRTTLIRFRPLRSEPDQEQHLFPHFMRHCRATHLVSVYGFREYELDHYMGWEPGSPMARVYVQLDWRDTDRLLRGVAALPRQVDTLPLPMDETVQLPNDLTPRAPGEQGGNAGVSEQEQVPGE